MYPGEVFRAQHHGSPVAVKVLQIRDDRTMLDACQEFGHLHNLRHSKLVVSYGACIDVGLDTLTNSITAKETI